jgi:hypothetical protein
MLVPVKVKAALAGLTVAGGAAAAALLGPAGQAVGQSSQPVEVSIQVNSPGTLVARGAGVNVPVTITCSGPSGTVAFGSMNLTERAGSEVAVGLGQSPGVACTGIAQTVTILVTPTFGGFPSVTAGKAFKRGTAIAQANVGACSPGGQFCANQTTQAIIAIQ